MEPVVLAGDVGGTSTRLALCQWAGGGPRVSTLEVAASREHAALDDLAAAFLARTGARPVAACFGVAGPVKHGRSVTTNLPWVVDAAALGRRLGIPRLDLVNDLEALAWGLAVVAPERMAALQAGEPDPDGNQAVIAAGTGLGEAGLTWDGLAHRPFPSEGGHASFAPVDETQIELLRFLRRELEGHVSVERVLSGPGLHHVYRFLRDTGQGEEPAWLARALAAGDPAAAISRAALEQRVPLADRALDLFVSIYGAEAGNLALKVLATGGLFVGGGIAPKIAARLGGPLFLEAFRAKGRLRPLLERIPVRLVLEDRTALLGAARCAARRAGLA